MQDTQDSQEISRPLENSLLEIKEETPKRENRSIFTRCWTMCWKASVKLTIAEKNKQKWKQFGYKSEEQALPSIFSLLIDLYNGKDVYDILEVCRINPDFTLDRYIRNDLEYFIPQFTNFMILHEDFNNAKLQILLHELSKTDPYFAHLFYWYTTSLSADKDQEKGQVILRQLIEECSDNPKSQVFVADYQRFYYGLERRLSKEDYENKLKEIETRKIKSLPSQSLNLEESSRQLGILPLRATDIDLKPYSSPFMKKEVECDSSPFTSTLLFYEDIALVSEELNKIDDKLVRLKDLLREINKSLPSCVYVPFVKNSLRHYAILNIVVDETRVFSTKERSPFYLCMELFRPQEELAHEYNEMFNIREETAPKPNNILSWAREKLQMTAKKLSSSQKEEHQSLGSINNDTDEMFRLSRLNEQASSVLTLKKTPIIPDHFGTKPLNRHLEPLTGFIIHSSIDLGQDTEIDLEEATSPKPQTFKSLMSRRMRSPDEIPGLITAVDRRRSSSLHTEGARPKASILEIHRAHAPKEINIQLNKLGTSIDDLAVEEQKGEGKEGLKKELRQEEISTRPSSTNYFKDDGVFFGEDSEVQAQRIRSRSHFKDLKSWKLIHLIVKSGADMKEEQFALQLVSQFDQIFKAEGLKLVLTPYEMVTLGSNIGVMEMIKDATTLSSLKEAMYRQGVNTLNEFFVSYYGKDVEKARKRFCRSLAAYSLLCYLLQIKDRHNGNIMLHKQGHIIHIDYGFFLSSAPGRGLEFEKKVPFKLLNEYVEVLGGPRSILFQEFRKQFYKGFVAARKHADQIIILVKMMYSSQGKNLPCFKAGDKTITELEKRFFPPGVSDGQLENYCYNLTNRSLDNWRAKCYDKYQYYFQGILY